MDERKMTLHTWLTEAYAMELDGMKVIEDHIDTASEKPEIQRRLQDHLEETQQHITQLKECIEQLDATLNRTTDTPNIMGALKNVASALLSDQVIKNTLIDYAAEQYEIATYKTIIQAAKTLDEPIIVTLCQSILESEQAMAQWLEDYLPVLVTDSLQPQA